MAHYMLSFATIHDPGKMGDYAERARRVVTDSGGEFVLRGIYQEAVEGDLEASGQLPTTAVVARWEDREAIDRMLDSPEYSELREMRRSFATATTVILGELPGAPSESDDGEGR
jgi:uncharacterized protein (DUF1330 family)